MGTPETGLQGEDQIDTLVVGAGPAGLAVAACLKQAGITAVILEQSDRVGASWRNHYERLHLHTAKATSGLPFARFPREYPRYPSRAQVIEYLDDYARRFGLDIRQGQRVVSARREGDRWVIKTQDATYTAANVVIATGHNREAFSPTWPGMDSFKGTLLHSAEYKNGTPFRGKAVLVVGFGNSGGEIAIDLVESGALTNLSVRGPVNVMPLELFGIPIQIVGILESWLPPALVDAVNRPVLNAVQGDLTRYGLRRRTEGVLTQIRSEAHIPLIDIGTIRLIKQGKITVYPGIERFTADGVVFVDGREAPFDAVILATGFRARVDAILEGAQAAYDENGTPKASGRESAVAGLYFCGYAVPSTGALREIAIEARRISGEIVKKHRQGS